MRNYLVQKLINNEVYAKVYTETQLINFLDMSDCYDEEYRIYDISVFGKIREVLYKGWQPNRLIQIVDSNGNIVASGYGTDH